ncbi:MAG: hypothetical protein N2379_10915, partial [Verrucomicrobiae bacterium]|nr:hypothetical protein [Verrucomicrobiae bacterium]
MERVNYGLICVTKESIAGTESYPAAVITPASEGFSLEFAPEFVSRALLDGKILPVAGQITRATANLTFELELRG